MATEQHNIVMGSAMARLCCPFASLPAGPRLPPHSGVNEAEPCLGCKGRPCSCTAVCRASCGSVQCSCSLFFVPSLLELAISQDVGIWLETDWYRKQAVIKEIKKDSYAFTSTDVHVRRN